MTAEIVSLYESNMRDIPATLREIADEIEEGKYGNVGCAGLVILGDTMEMFGMGEDSDVPSVNILFNAACLRFAKTLEEHGK